METGFEIPKWKLISLGDCSSKDTERTLAIFRNFLLSYFLGLALRFMFALWTVKANKGCSGAGSIPFNSYDNGSDDDRVAVTDAVEDSRPWYMMWWFMLASYSLQ